MKHLILLISTAYLLHAGQCTPSYSGGHDSGSHSSYVSAPVGYYGPLAKPYVLPDGHIADTPEVAAAKHLHYAAIQKAKTVANAHAYSGDDGSYGSGGGYASSGLGYGSGAGYGSSYGSGAGYGSSYGSGAGYGSSYGSGAGYGSSYGSGAGYGSSYGSGAGYGSSYGSEAGYGSSYGSGAGYGSSYGSGAGYGSSYGSGAGYGSSYGSGAGYAGGYSYSGPLAYPKVLPSGLLADTHEVAAAKHAHLNAVAVTAREHAQKWSNNYYH